MDRTEHVGAPLTCSGLPNNLLAVLLQPVRDPALFLRKATLACIYTLVYTTHMDEMHAKPLVWLGSSLEDLRASPPDARRLAGYQLRRVQAELMPSDYKPVKAVGPGVYEIRIHTRLEHRVFYVARLAEIIYALHAFEKRTRQTRQADVNLAKRRLAEVLNLHRSPKES